MIRVRRSPRTLAWALALGLWSPAFAQHPGPADHEGHTHPAGAAHGGHGGHGAGDHATMHHRFKDVAWAKKHFEDPKRKAWQKPRALVAALQIAPGAAVADLGAGSGYFLPFLAEAVGPTGTVFAVEVEPELIEWLRTRADKEGLTQVVPVLSSFDRLRLPNAGVDLAMMVDVYHHIDDRKAWFTRALRAVRPGGRMVVVDFKPGDLPVGPPKGHKISAAQITEEMTAAGWTLVQTLDLLPHQNVVIFRRPLEPAPASP